MDGKYIQKSKTISNGIWVPDADYLHWIDDLKQRYQRSQIKAAIKVNSELLKFIGRLVKILLNDNMIIGMALTFMKI